MSRKNAAPSSAATICIGLAGLAWAGNALYATGEPGGPIRFWSPAIVAGAMIAYLIIHGSIRYSPRQLTGFVFSVFLIGWLLETLSILTGFPFGSYHYTELMAPFLGHVPVSVMPAYCVMGYASWSMARIMLNRMDGSTDAVLRFGAPLIAAVLMVIWDLSMDPLRATIEQRWVWQSGGPHFGVPAENYFGWALVTWLMFQTFALCFLKPDDNAPPDAGLTRGYWLSAPLVYAAFAGEYLLNPIFSAGASAMVVIDGQAVAVAAIYREVALIAGLTMVPVAGLAALLVVRAYGRADVPVRAAATVKLERTR